MDNIKEERQKRGRRSRASGKKFELKVRKSLESQGYFVCKWMNTVIFDDKDNGTLVAAKSKFNPFLHRTVSEGSGFPDFLAFKKGENNTYKVLGVESKKAKYLDAKERAMANWLIKNNVFSKIYVAFPVQKGRRKQVVYQTFVPDDA